MIALNDAVLSRVNSRLVLLCTRVNGEPLTEFNADGLIVATPTGSTAYCCPLVDRFSILSPVFVITPICPHVLNESIDHCCGWIDNRDRGEHPDYPVFLTLDGRKPIHVDEDQQ
jgi:NAD+ kinase